MLRPSKTLARRPKKPWRICADKGFATMLVGGFSLVLYLTMIIISGVYLGEAKTGLSSKGQLDAIVKECNVKSIDRTAINSILEHTIGLTVRVILWTWLLTIYLISFMVYLVYVIAAWQRNYSLGRGYLFVAGIITLLNFVPCSYIFSFGDIAVQEIVAYCAMLGVILCFRIMDVVVMYIFVKDMKNRKSSGGTMSQSQSVLVVQSEPEITQDPFTIVQVSPEYPTTPQTEPKRSSNPPPDPPLQNAPKRSSNPPGNPFEETPQ